MAKDKKIEKITNLIKTPKIDEEEAKKKAKEQGLDGLDG